jgi:hypothetical protein
MPWIQPQNHKKQQQKKFEKKHSLSALIFHLCPPCSLCISLPYLLINSIYTHVSCHGFFPWDAKEFGSLLITDCTSALNTIKKMTKARCWWLMPEILRRMMVGSQPRQIV